MRHCRSGAARRSRASTRRRPARRPRLEELRLAAIESRGDALLRGGKLAGVIAELETLTKVYPPRERLWYQRMLALYQSDRHPVNGAVPPIRYARTPDGVHIAYQVLGSGGWRPSAGRRARRDACRRVAARRAVRLLRRCADIGEVTLDRDGVRGAAVRITACVAALAGPGEIVVSRTVRDLLAGAGYVFIDRGSHRLGDSAEEWQLFAVAPG